MLNLRVGYDGGPDGILFSPFIGVQNLTNELYNGNVRINAFGGRYYEPAPELSVYAGMTMGYRR